MKPEISALDPREVICARFPALRAAPLEVLTHSYDSTAIDAGGLFIFKFPRSPEAEASLRREARFLGEIRPRVPLGVPELQLFEEPRLFSRHRKIAGEHLTATAYLALVEAAKQRLGEDLARFYAALHALDAAALRAAGARPVAPWLPLEEIARGIALFLPPHLAALANAAVARFANLPPDPQGRTFGWFDGHGWNMAFDHECGRLNGVYDFSDSGTGPLHQDFIYTNFVAPDLTRRIVGAYEGLTGKSLDRDRLWLLTAIHRLSELAQEGHDHTLLPERVRRVTEWLMMTDAGPG